MYVRSTWSRPATLALVVMLMSGCAGIDRDPSAGTVTASVGIPTGPPATPTADEIRAGFDEIAGRTAGELALAWAPIGTTGRVQSLGGLTDSDAWSTLKVPIALATLERAEGRPDAATQALVRAMIVRSDNRSAATLYGRLGTRAEAAERLEAPLRAAGDGATQVRESEFGRTPWSMTDQAQFAAALPCLPHGDQVLSLMGRVTEEHAWGLGAVAGTALVTGTRFKGGWGPGASGFLARQVGVLTLADGSMVAVTVAAHPWANDYATATRHVTTMAKWIVSKLNDRSGGRCPASTTAITADPAVPTASASPPA